MRTYHRLAIAIVAGVLGLGTGLVGIGGVRADGITYTVAPGGTATCSSGQQVGTNFGTIRDALDCAAADNPSATNPDIIDIAAGTYQENLIVGANVNLIGMGDVTVDARGNGTVVTISNGETVGITGLTITGGSALDLGFHGAGGIDNEGTLTLTDSTIEGNSASCTESDSVCLAAGAGIFNDTGATLTLNNSTVKGNTASCVASDGSCPVFGGGIENVGTLTLSNSMVSGNTASCEMSGQGFCAAASAGIDNYSGSTLTLVNSMVKENTVSCTAIGFMAECNAYGGGIGNSGTLTLNNSAIKGNSASCYLESGSVGCQALGGGIYNGGTVTLTNSTVSKNTPTNCDGSPSVTGCKG